jgi:hypothetical protein
VHRRLYRADQLDVIDAARYVEELLQDLAASMGEEWKAHLGKICTRSCCQPTAPSALAWC